MKDSKTIFLIDGMSYLFRAYYALPPLTRKKDNLPVGALSGFSNVIYKIIYNDDTGIDFSHIAVIFDRKEPTFRKDMYPLYKANRELPPDDLAVQFPLVRDVVDAFNIISLDKIGYEADDIIATIAKKGSKEGYNIIILSSDKDLMQLVDDKIKIYDGFKNKLIGREDVIEKFGVPPEKVVDVQALAGDSVDNIPGVPKIGIKTAALLINEYGDLENLLANAGEIKQKMRRENLLTYADEARISYKLAKLCDEVELDCTIANLKRKDVDLKKLADFFHDMEFMQLARRLQSNVEISTTEEAGNTQIKEKENYSVITSENDLKNYLKKCGDNYFLAIDTETDSLDVHNANLVGLSLACKKGEAVYIPFIANHEDDKDKNLLSIDIVRKLLAPILIDKSILKIGHNLKFDLHILNKHGFELFPICDTMLMSYAYEGLAQRHGLDNLVAHYFGHDMISYDDLCKDEKKKITFDFVALEKAAHYAAEDADYCLRLYFELKDNLISAKKTSLFYNIDMPLVNILRKIEDNGFKIDVQKMNQLSQDFEAIINEKEKRAYELANQEFNLASPKQVSHILYDVMGIDGMKKTSTGAFSTNIQALEKLAHKNIEIAQVIIDHRQISKLKSTYSDVLPKMVDGYDRLHTSFALTHTTTGRMSSNEPNLQNIPIRSDHGRKIREAFICDDNNILLCADYSQIELRILAKIANIKSMEDAFNENIDIHNLTASQIFNVDINNVNNDQRRRAKSINFGIIYGISPYGLSNQLSIAVSEAKYIIDSYFRQFPGIKKYMDEQIDFAKKNGKIYTLFNRTIDLKNINSNNYVQRQNLERAAINAPIQGSAADIMRLSLIEADKFINNKFSDCKILLQVHDELVIECPKDRADDLGTEIKKLLEQMTLEKMGCKLRVDIGTGKNWETAH